MLTVTLIAAVSLCLGGCGGSSDNGIASKSAAEILAATRKAAQSASAVHVDANATLLKTAKTTLDASLAQQQAHARFSFYRSDFEAIRTGNTLYIKGNHRFNTRLERRLGAKIPAGVWLKGSTSGPLAQLGSLTNIKQELPLLLSGTGKLTKGATTRIDGRPVIELKQKRILFTATLYVATTGEPYPLRLRKAGRETGQTNFTGWNDPVHVDPPANAVDIDQLAHKAG